MKRLMGLVAALALLATSSVANAVDNAWFTLESTTCTGVTSTSGPGQPLNISKNNDATCNLVIGYRANAEGPQGTSFLRSYALKLNTVADVTASNLDFAPGNALGFTTNFNTQPPPVGTLFEVGGSNGVGNGTDIAPAGALLFRFTLTVAKPNLTGTHNIFGAFGSSAQFYGEYGTGAWQGSVGNNPATNGQNTVAWGPNAVISITNVPEPATLALLGFGALALIRRRR